MNSNFGDDRKYYPGSWSLFLYRPEFHDSRSAMLARIQEQLVSTCSLMIAEEVSIRYNRFKQAPANDPHLSQLEFDLTHLPASCRYIPLSIYYPEKPGYYLMRGLKARKEDLLFYESIRDLIRKGCGPFFASP